MSKVMCVFIVESPLLEVLEINIRNLYVSDGS